MLKLGKIKHVHISLHIIIQNLGEELRRGVHYPNILNCLYLELNTSFFAVESATNLLNNYCLYLELNTSFIQWILNVSWKCYKRATERS